MSRIAVVGAGMAGLSATYSLAKVGIPVTLIEADHVPGGRLATREELSLEHRGQTFTFPIEHGIHGVWRPYYNLRRLLQELGTFSTLTPAPYQELVAEQRGQRVFPEVGARLRQHPLPSLLARIIHQTGN